MAERRMFAKTIIDSDAFIDMPLTAQAFYFHLSMRADDDGFVNNPKKIQRMIGCADDDMRLLIAKRFVIPFESGVCVIKHWKIHNYIQNDRYKETVYQDEKRLLITKENRAYSLSEEACIQIGYNTDTQNRVDKDSKGLDKDSTSQQCEDASRSLSVDYQSVIDMFNTVCVSLPTVKILTDQRRKAIKALYPFIEENGGFQAFFERVEASDFLSGRTENKWRACFDWVIKRANAAKLIEGNYDNRSGNKKNGSGGEDPDYTDIYRYENASMEV